LIIHYQNVKGEGKFIKDVLHLQNVDDVMFEALLTNGKTLYLRVSGIEGIYDKGEENLPETAKTVRTEQ
jgi:hypothetical protein